MGEPCLFILKKSVRLRPLSEINYGCSYVTDDVLNLTINFIICTQRILFAKHTWCIYVQDINS